jgi:hypothetical protein
VGEVTICKIQNQLHVVTSVVSLDHLWLCQNGYSFWNQDEKFYSVPASLYFIQLQYKEKIF